MSLTRDLLKAADSITKTQQVMPLYNFVGVSDAIADAETGVFSLEGVDLAATLPSGFNRKGGQVDVYLAVNVDKTATPTMTLRLIGDNFNDVTVFNQAVDTQIYTVKVSIIPLVAPTPLFWNEGGVASGIGPNLFANVTGSETLKIGAGWSDAHEDNSVELVRFSVNYIPPVDGV